MALQYPVIPEDDYDGRRVFVFSIVRYLNQARERHWCWALQMMADPDLDSVRRFSGEYGEGLSRIIYDDFEWGSVWISLKPDGAAVARSNRQDWNEEGGLGDGYYCIVGEYVFLYMPSFEFGFISSPDSGPASMYPISEFLPETVPGK